MKKLKNFLECNEKENWWLNRNYFFVATLILITSMVLIYAFIPNQLRWDLASGSQPHWNDHLNFINIFISFWASFSHLNALHLFGNMLTFTVLGMYFERRLGSLKFLTFILLLAFFTSTAISANINTNWTGFSGVNFALKTFVILNFISLLLSNKKISKSNIAWQLVSTAWVFITMSVQLEPFAIRLYPFQNMGHYSSMLAGLILFLTLALFKIKKPSKPQN